MGGVRKAVARRAESLYTHLDGPEQEAVRQLFLRIATVSDTVIGRRRVPASELAALDVDIVALQSAIDSFARYRLLALDRDPTTGAPTVEVAHEALLGEWHRLRDWIDESRDDLATHARFAVAVQEWETAGREPGYLLTGARLEDYERWASTSRLRLTVTEQAFIEQSVGRTRCRQPPRARAGGGRRPAATPIPVAARRSSSARRPCSPASSPIRSSRRTTLRSSSRWPWTRLATPAGSTRSLLAASNRPPRSTGWRP